MTINELNNILATLSQNHGREKVFEFAFALTEWMGLKTNADNKPQLLSPQTQKLKEYLVPAPQTVQPQLYRLTADGQNIRVRFAVIKKLKKEYISQLVDNDPGLTSYQSFIKGLKLQPGSKTFIPTQPYFIHFVTTPAYDRLILIFNHGDQKRVVSFRNRLTNTQYNKIILKWQDIANKSKPEIADLLWKSLDIKEVNREFYRQVKERFDALVGIAKSSKVESTENQLKQFAVRLIGRYIFCWFLKEKGIIPAQLISSATISENKNDYYKKYLLHLFFNTLNTEVQNREVSLKSEDLFQLFLKIPYLNGGLFDKHKEDDLFNDLELNDWLLKFVEILEEFDFTVDESSSNYQLVAIDPEMLGRIFENLLASQNPETEKMANQRKALGAFYTPREIVDYMVDSSLKNYLEQKLLPAKDEETNKVAEPEAIYEGALFQFLESKPKQPELSVTPENKNKISEYETKQKNIRIKIDKLFSPACSENPFDKTETAKVQNALRDIKILDPACGSGAFPMGILLRLMELREIVGNSLSNSYELKNEILSRNIFGVDIMPMAIEIARLRAWLSLVLEADYKPSDTKHNFGIKALPNLDFKFICANTLIDNGYDSFLQHVDETKTPELMRLNSEIQKLENLRNDYFDPKGDKNIKEKLRTEFRDTKECIKNNFQNTRKGWKNFEEFLSKVDDWNPFDDSKPSSFFSSGWMFGIKTPSPISGEGKGEGGFDVVIGNPPYGVKIPPEELKQHILNYPMAKKVPDSYCFFIIRSFNLLHPKGIVTLIVPNTFCDLENGEVLRKHLLEKKQILMIWQSGWAFDSAIVDTLVFFARNNKLTADSSIKITVNDQIYLRQTSDFLSNSLSKIDYRNPPGKSELLRKIRNLSVPLENIAGVKAGVKMYEKGKGNPPQTEKITTDRPYSIVGECPNGWKQLYRGTNINRFSLNPTNEFVNYGPWLAAPRSAELFNSPKILMRRTDDKLRSAIELDSAICVNSCHIIKLNSGVIQNFSYEFLLGCLNSRIIQFFFEVSNPQMLGKVFAEIKVIYVEQLPILNISVEKQQPIESLVNQILAAKQKDPHADTMALEAEIDQLVYALYGLTEDEIAVVEEKK